jgi:hypothetical protein
MAIKKRTAATPEEAAKSRLLGKARKLMRDAERYAAFGYVTRIEDYEADDRRLIRAIDGLYDAARKAGIAEDLELQNYRTQLRAVYVDARQKASDSRRSLYAGVAGKLGGGAASGGMQGYLDELKIDDARRRSKR